MSTNAVVNKLTKAQLTTVLNENFKAVKRVSKEIADSIQYTAKAYKEDEKNVTKKDLLDLVKDVMNALGDKFILATDSMDISVPVLAENSVKPSGKKLSKKSKAEPKEEEPETEETDEEPKEEAPKKPAKKGGKKKESAVTVANEDEEDTPAILLAETFKDEIVLSDDDGESKYQIAHDIDSMEKLVEAFNNEETIVFAMYWSKRYLQQFPYFNGEFKAPKEFPLDLDIASCMYVSDDNVVAYAISLYTEGCYVFKPQDFKEYDGIRFSSGIEFQIYRLVE